MSFEEDNEDDEFCMPLPPSVSVQMACRQRAAQLLRGVATHCNGTAGTCSGSGSPRQLLFSGFAQADTFIQDDEDDFFMPLPPSTSVQMACKQRAAQRLKTTAAAAAAVAAPEAPVTPIANAPRAAAARRSVAAVSKKAGAVFQQGCSAGRSNSRAAAQKATASASKSAAQQQVQVLCIDVTLECRDRALLSQSRMTKAAPSKASVQRAAAAAAAVGPVVAGNNLSLGASKQAAAATKSAAAGKHRSRTTKQAAPAVNAAAAGKHTQQRAIKRAAAAAAVAANKHAQERASRQSAAASICKLAFGSRVSSKQ
jgi:hypothetical protein